MERVVGVVIVVAYFIVMALCILIGGLCNRGKLFRFGLILNIIFCILYIIAKYSIIFGGG